MEDLGIARFWQGKRVLVTGVTGLVGGWLTRALVEGGAFVVGLVRDWDPQSELIRSRTVDRITVTNGALEDYRSIERPIAEHEIDTVFHLAAQTIVGAALRNPLLTFEANVRGTYHVLEVCRQHRQLVKRIVVASSDKAYGISDVLPYTEDMPPSGRFPYDVSKSCADLITQAYHRTYCLPVAIARCGNVYGGGDLNWSRLVPGTIRSLVAGQRPMIRSDGSYTRDYVYVQDAVRAYLAIAEALDRADVPGEAFNFGPHQPHTVMEIVAKLRHLMRREDLEPLIADAARAEIRDQYLSCAKAERVLGWHPKYTLDQGLLKTIAWYTRFFAARREERSSQDFSSASE